jgi:Protein of unknown function (DUF3987)
MPARNDLPDFAAHCENACRQLWGEPAKVYKNKLTWHGTRGDGYGGKTFNRIKRTWYDHDLKCGGSTLHLVDYAELGTVKKPLKGAAFFDAWRAAYRRGWVPEPPPEREGGSSVWEQVILRTHPYRDERGEVLYESVRFDTTDPNRRFRIRRPNGNGGWITNSMEGIRWVPYRLPELIATSPGDLVLICEGERDADTAVQLGFVATTAPCGVDRGWRSEFNQYFANRDVVVVSDNDPGGTGQRYAADVAKQVSTVAARVRVASFSVKDLTEWVEAGGTREQLTALIEAAATTRHERTAPVDLWGQFDPPPLPRGLLPETIERFAFAQGAMMGADPAGLAVAALAVCAAVIPDHVMLQPKRYDSSWTEVARIWVALVGTPSDKKSPIIKQTAKPLFRIDYRMCRDNAERKKHYDALSPEERKLTSPPPQPRLRLEDTTIEAAQQVLKDSPNGVLCLQDELSGWFGGMDKYSGGHRGAMKDRGFWLQAFSGDTYSVDRIGRGSWLIPNLSVCVLGGIQPDVIRKLAAETVDDGLLQRLFPRRAAYGDNG